MNTSALPTSGATQSLSLSGEEPMDCSVAPGPLRDFESVLTQQNVELYLMQNHNIIESEVDHEFLKLNEVTDTSKTDEYRMKFVNLLIKKSQEINNLFETTNLQEFQHIRIFRQLVIAYAKQGKMSTEGLGAYLPLPKGPMLIGGQTEFIRQRYAPLKEAFMKELSGLSTEGRKHLLRILESTSGNTDSLEECRNTADRIPLSINCPLHFTYIELLCQLKQEYKHQNIVSAPPPPSRGFFG